MTQTPFQAFGPQSKFDPVEQTDFVSDIEKNQNQLHKDLEARNREIFKFEYAAGVGRDKAIMQLAPLSQKAASLAKPWLQAYSDRQDMALAQQVKTSGASMLKAQLDFEEDLNDTESTAHNGMVTQARSIGDIDILLEQELRNVDPAKQSRFKRLLLKEHAENYGQFYAQAAVEMKVPVVTREGERLDITLAEAGNNQYLKSQVKAAISNAWMRPWIREDQAMVKKYLYDPMEKHEAIKEQEDLTELEKELKEVRLQ